jgi:6-phosphofructokinase 2
MGSIITVTPNPAIDVFASVDKVFAMHKLRCTSARRDPGGGGINVARVVRRLGGEVTAVYPVGRTTGEALRRLMDQEDIRSVPITIAQDTREDFTVLEQASGHQYRFVLPGPAVSEAEWRGLLDAVATEAKGAEFIVASGSVAPGMPDDFYAQLARLARELGCKMVVDTSAAPLSAALREGVYLVKPNLRELQQFVNEPLTGEANWIASSRTLVDSFPVDIVALSMGHHGALVTTAEGAWRAPALPVRPVSVAGAGDSFLGAMVWSLAQGMSVIDGLRYAVAAGSAAVLNAGTQLCQADDVHALYPQVTVRKI